MDFFAGYTCLPLLSKTAYPFLQAFFAFSREEKAPICDLASDQDFLTQ